MIKLITMFKNKYNFFTKEKKTGQEKNKKSQQLKKKEERGLHLTAVWGKCES